MSLDLTVAIPAHDDTAALSRLLSRLVPLEVAARVIVVDDASQARVDAARLCAETGLNPAHLTVLHHARNKGAGAARNLALLWVKTAHVLFLDADDLPTRALRGLCADLAGRNFDFCLFQHHDSRMEQDRLWGQMGFDQGFWDEAGVALGALSEVTPEAMGPLVQTANYPWNKIYRTAFLRDHGIRCSETAVHNDIELHWRSFLHGRHVLASDRVAAIHFVHAGGGRLTNRRGEERLRVFATLDRLAVEIRQTPEREFTRPFFLFSIGLLDWIRGTLTPDLQPRFAELATGFLNRHLTRDLRAAIIRAKPEAYARVIGGMPPQ